MMWFELVYLPDEQVGMRGLCFVRLSGRWIQRNQHHKLGICTQRRNRSLMCTICLFVDLTYYISCRKREQKWVHYSMPNRSRGYLYNQPIIIGRHKFVLVNWTHCRLAPHSAKEKGVRCHLCICHLHLCAPVFRLLPIIQLPLQNLCNFHPLPFISSPLHIHRHHTHSPLIRLHLHLCTLRPFNTRNQPIKSLKQPLPLQCTRLLNTPLSIPYQR